MAEVTEYYYHRKYVDSCTYEENVTKIKRACQSLRDHLVSWERKDFIIGYCIKELKIYIFVAGNLGFDVEGWDGFSVDSQQDCDIIDPMLLSLFKTIEIIDKA